jgi:hypothetical protein
MWYKKYVFLSLLEEYLPTWNLKYLKNVFISTQKNQDIRDCSQVVNILELSLLSVCAFAAKWLRK